MYLPFESMLTYQKTSEKKKPEKLEPTFPQRFGISSVYLVHPQLIKREFDHGP